MDGFYFGDRIPDLVLIALEYVGIGGRRILRWERDADSGAIYGPYADAAPASAAVPEMAYLEYEDGSAFVRWVQGRYRRAWVVADGSTTELRLRVADVPRCRGLSVVMECAT